MVTLAQSTQSIDTSRTISENNPRCDSVPSQPADDKDLAEHVFNQPELMIGDSSTKNLSRLRTFPLRKPTVFRIVLSRHGEREGGNG